MGSIAICGTQKTVIYTYGEHPAGKTHPIGASGAITSDLIGPNINEYMCCFMAKEKRLLVFKLRQKSIVVSSNTSSICQKNKLVFMLITPIGAFHWMVSFIYMVK